VTIVIIHILSYGLWPGLFFSWLAAHLGSILCFLLARHFLQDWSQKMWNKHQEKYKRAFDYVDRYGFWGLILLRSIFFMPSNIISILGALSPISFKHYFWSSLIGNIPMVILLAVLSSPFVINDSDRFPLLIVLIVTIMSLVAIFIYQQRTHRLKQ
jgi:uncharacterized membrane protein YdjX (TVP38/TMEM64 family)